MGGGAFLRGIDIYRHIPKDLTEASKIGGAVSIIAVLSLLTLFILELRSLLATSVNTTILVSHREDDEFRVGVNFTFPGVACDWISIDYLDVVGHKKENLTDNSIHKYTLHGEFVADAVRTYEQKPVKYVDVAPERQAVADPNRVHHIELTPENWENTLQSHHLVLVNFYAPWCPHCVRFAPIYEDAAKLIDERHPSPRDVALGSVDCTSKANQMLCYENHIQAFPTVRVFRESSDNPDTKKGHMHEEYRGSRAPEDIATFVINAFDEMKKASPEIQAEAEAEADSGKPKREYSSFGCVVSGYVKVSRVPGTLIFTPHAPNHNINADSINMTHIINHLSFGASDQKLPKKAKKRKQALSEAGVYAGDESHTAFVSLARKITHEHYLKVVPRMFQPLRGELSETYEYTINSNIYPVEKEDTPSVRIVWDIWPMEVVETQVRKPLVEGVCQMVGFLGGVFTFFHMFEGFVNGAWKRFQKAQEGKLG